MTIGERIRYYRKSADMTQRELAAASGIHYVSICNYESGKMTPRDDQLRKIATVWESVIPYLMISNPKQRVLELSAICLNYYCLFTSPV